MTKAVPRPISPKSEKAYLENSPGQVIFEWSATRDETSGEVYRFEILDGSNVIDQKEGLTEEKVGVPVVNLQGRDVLFWRVRTEVVQHNEVIATSEWSVPLEFKITVQTVEAECPRENQTLTGCE
jgi:hypothetical protein